MKKKDIKKILSGFDSVEMPSKEKILSSCPRAEIKAVTRKTKKRTVIIALAAVIALLSIAGCAAEVKEYNDAVTFFAEHSLSTKDLSRGDIKKVYRDIITEKFELEKTAIVIIDSVKGYAVGITEPTSEELKRVWNDLNVKSNEPYSWYYLDNEIEEDGIVRGGEMMLRRLVDCEVIWETKIPLRDGYIQDYTLIDGGKRVAVYGVYSPSARGTKHCGFIELFDAEDGRSIWRRIFDDYKFFSVNKVLCEKNGIVAFCRGDLENFIFMRLDGEGEVTLKRVTEIGNLGIWNAAALGDGYVVQLGGYQTEEKLCKVTRNGEISEGFSYSSSDTAYFIKDMLEYGGKLYLSAYAVPKNGESIQSGRGEISAILDRIFDSSFSELEQHPDASIGYHVEDLTEMLRENYTALLMICNSESGRPDVFYSAEGSLAGALSVNEKGEMLWETEYISDSYFSPATSAFTIAGGCHVYEHIFAADGSLISSEKTERVSGFSR